MTTAVIVQARMASTRLPGKVMQELAGRTVLHHVLSRCTFIRGADVVVCAVPDEPASTPLEHVAAESGATVYRGPEKDVLARYLGAAAAVGASTVMRVTSDCPLIDPEICDQVISLRTRETADFATNNTPRTYPQGLDCEAFTAKALADAANAATDPFDREHVTPWLRRAPQLKRANLSSGVPTLSSHRWTLDYPEDLAFLRAIFNALPAGSRAGMSEVLRLLATRPDIMVINANRAQGAAS